MKKAFLLSLAILSTILSFGQTIDTDRPTQGASAIVIPKGSFQIEAGLAAAKATTKGNNNYRAFQFAVPTNTFRYAFVKNIEFRLVTQINHFYEKYTHPDFRYTTSSYSIAVSDLQLGFKFQLLNKEDKRLKLGWLTHFITPTGSEGFNNESFGIDNKFLISHTIGDVVTMGYNLGHTYLEYGYHQAFVSLSATVKIKERFSLFVEEYYYLTEGYGNQDINLNSNINGGVTFLAKDNLQIDLSIGSNLNLENEDFFRHSRFISAGVSWLIQKRQ
jgi:hypothetical protein